MVRNLRVSLQFNQRKRFFYFEIIAQACRHKNVFHENCCQRRVSHQQSFNIERKSHNVVRFQLTNFKRIQISTFSHRQHETRIGPRSIPCHDQ